MKRKIKLSAKKIVRKGTNYATKILRKVIHLNLFTTPIIYNRGRDYLEIGYIKKIHCKIFYKPGAENLKISVKAIEKNGKIKKVFVKVIY